MAITYPISVPRIADIKSISFSAVDKIAVTESIYSFKRQAVAHSGQRWESSVTLVPMTQARARAWIAFLTQVKGSRNEFLLGDYSQQTMRGLGTGTPLVDGAGQTGNELMIDGATELATGWILAGDMFSLGSGVSMRLYQNLTDVNIDSGGSAVLDIYPDLQITPGDNASLDLTTPEGAFVLSGNIREWSYQNNSYQISFDAESVV